MSDGEMKFSVLCSLFRSMQSKRKKEEKKDKFRKFLDVFCKPDDYFPSIRLILPYLDRERGNYGLKESVLATVLIEAIGISPDSEDGVRLINWRKGGAKTGINAGSFSLVAAEVLEHRRGTGTLGLTVKELNELLDRLASAEIRADKIKVLETLINRTDAEEMKWVIRIILKDLKVGASEKTVFPELHPDAEDLFNVTCDLRLVCEKLRSRSQRHKRQDIEVGKPVMPQFAKRVANASVAWDMLHGKEVVVECKFDGDRIQIHKNGPEVHFFSRKSLDHSEYEHGMSEIIEKNILADRCILDGEMLVWDTSLNRFAEFGSNQGIAKAARERLDSERQLCYVAFDVLYVGDTSVIHQSLKERHELLSKVVKPVKGRLEILIPSGSGLNASLPAGEPSWSRIAYSVDDVERFFKETVENRDEGIVLKDLGSNWTPSDRSYKWMKLKPDYVNAGSDLDVLIIGGYYGSGRRGGEVAQFLVGLAERPVLPDKYPTRFLSFCRVGTGVSDDELKAVVSKLKPFFRKNEYPKKPAPSFYQVTNHSKERPDVWINSPEQSIILSITSDIRTAKSEVFSAPYCLRFPRIDRVRDDKAWHECLDVQSFVELVHSSNGTTQRATGNVDPLNSRPKHAKSSKRGRRNLSNVPKHLTHTDVSSVKEETFIFSNMMFYFVNAPPKQSIDSLHKFVAENGGTFSMNLNNSVTHCIAAESKGIKYQAAKNHGDIIHYSWLLDCCNQKKLIPLQPKHFMFLSELSKKKLQEDIDEFADPYFVGLEVSELKQLLENIDVCEDSGSVEHYKQKYCPKKKWSRFRNCCIHFHISSEQLNSDWDVVFGLARKRMELEVSMGGGKIVSSLLQTTHLIVLSKSGYDVDFDSAMRSLSVKDRDLIHTRRINVSGSQWLEDFLTTDQILQDVYSVKLDELEHVEMKKSEINSKAPSCSDNVKKEEPAFSSTRGVKRGRGRPPSSSTHPLPRLLNKRKKEENGTSLKRGRNTVSQPRQKRARLGKKAAKISEVDSDKDDSPNEEGGQNDSDADPGVEFNETGVPETNRKSDPYKSSLGSMVTKSASPKAKESVSHTDERNPKEVSSEISDEEKKKSGPEELEIVVENDPFQAMLLNMIPSLGRVASVDPVATSSTVVDPKSSERSSASEVGADPKPGAETLGEPVKKRKVSYKDVAFELLKD